MPEVSFHSLRGPRSPLVRAPLNQIRDWATHHAREVEALSRRPHGALFFVRAVSEGSARVLGVAAQMMAIHSSELAAAEASASVITRGPTDHWKPWKRDSLDALESTLGGHGEKDEGGGFWRQSCGVKL